MMKRLNGLLSNMFSKASCRCNLFQYLRHSLQISAGLEINGTMHMELGLAGSPLHLHQVWGKPMVNREKPMTRFDQIREIASEMKF